MEKERYNIHDLEIISGHGNYSIVPPCCGMKTTNMISIGSIIKNRECWNCGAKIDIELVLES